MYLRAQVTVEVVNGSIDCINEHLLTRWEETAYVVPQDHVVDTLTAHVGSATKTAILLLEKLGRLSFDRGACLLVCLRACPQPPDSSRYPDTLSFMPAHNARSMSHAPCSMRHALSLVRHVALSFATPHHPHALQSRKCTTCSRSAADCARVSAAAHSEHGGGVCRVDGQHQQRGSTEGSAGLLSKRSAGLLASQALAPGTCFALLWACVSAVAESSVMCEHGGSSARSERPTSLHISRATLGMLLSF